ncbi:precorrin-2 dehydrogenase/sirohydrochlorin ferrochelatase family protein [Wukongibacter sp. M2B1]|uniref:precorrin-2 dehydrogenase/sirohydrochlorin ferrochelatase family protein n=1 Tax=Wukongibacter sp. M2B1 TaxID=3088895 RepID=UPI003D7B8B1E
MGKYYPIMLNIKGKSCKVIGGGRVAERKVTDLLKADSIVTVISPFITEKLLKYYNDGKINLIEREYRYGDLNGSHLVYAATDDREVNETCLKECREKGILLNVVDKPDMCDFIVPSKITRGDLTITVSTNGKSPMLSSKIRKELENLFTEEYGDYLEILGDIREKVKADIQNIEKRRKVFRSLVYSDLFDRYLNGEDLDLKDELLSLCKAQGVEIDGEKRNNNRQQRE